MKKTVTQFIFSILVLGFSIINNTYAQEYRLNIDPPYPAQINRKFGTSVSVSGNIAIVGTPRHITDGSTTGRAFFFGYNDNNTADPNDDTWQLLQDFIADTTSSGDWFGRSVSTDGNYAIIGAPEKDVNNLGF